MTHALALRSWLEDIHPLAPWLALSLGAWLAVYAWRKLFPGLWLRLETLDKPLSVAIGALPSVIMTTAVGALTAGSDPWTLVGASLMGVGAPLLHHLLKALPIPYQGQPAAKEPPVTRRTMLLIVLLGLPGCGARPPQRDPCYLRADADALAAYLRECDGYASTDDCPAAPAIEERHQAAQEVCP